ncbi:MAG: VOC family protein, partial [Tepidiformaceae bacterium]
GRPPQTEAGVLVHIMVANMDATIAALMANGGTLDRPVGADLPEVTARFRDLSGNLFGLYQERTLA